MNNYAEITINGQKQPLLFGMFAVEEFNRIQLERSELNGNISANQGLGIADIVCAGAYNYSVVKRVKTHDYSIIIEAICDMYGDDEFLPELNALSQAFLESRFGRQIEKQTDQLKKNILDESLSPSITVNLESSPTES